MAIIISDSGSNSLQRGTRSRAVAVCAGATHGIFFGDAEIKFKSADLDGTVVTDTIALRSAVSGLVQQLSCAELLARSIAQIEVGGSVCACSTVPTTSSDRSDGRPPAV
ncbi:hypothetical protein [Pseudonocardia sp. NPDC046786]|uniref:hypothetical protein n=1 Tax=Pseudonocardia sp. NPDC046786 TaxID=3155471 RepID=UPI0033C5E16A